MAERKDFGSSERGKKSAVGTIDANSPESATSAVLLTEGHRGETEVVLLKQSESYAFTSAVCGKGGRSGFVEDLHSSVDFGDNQCLCFIDKAVKFVSPVEMRTRLEEFPNGCICSAAAKVYDTCFAHPKHLPYPRYSLGSKRAGWPQISAIVDNTSKPAKSTVSLPNRNLEVLG
ncbi:hypothetical protein PoB_006278900 [Plakobranchus ocellatus]|uniref:Uncharacterized protein n=1 Tax=Plakobranchus ocellatus TaxID=259542 RepID=A0AAV4CWL8_9GAST|nr:hypothetical protein PoB_006278900 [Plakobranchus ocellatus]